MIKQIGQFFLDIVETLVIALSIFLVVYLFLLQPHQVNGQSMVPNFQSGEYLLTDKISYRLGEPKRGDVVVFHAPEAAHCPKGTGCDFIKRVLGLPGETIEIKNSQVYVNSTPLKEDYIPADFETQPGDFTRNKSVSLGSDEYFVVGDNRPYSSDSRAWGPIQRTDIVGKAFVRYWPVDSIGTLPKIEYRR
ncbi:MAG: signal peptidase I [Candidatus Pacebacteria bacterium]|nr:signal peptidase I [Candidatus Paceibacterota bacterium]